MSEITKINQNLIMKKIDEETVNIQIVENEMLPAEGLDGAPDLSEQMIGWIPRRLPACWPRSMRIGAFGQLPSSLVFGLRN